MECVWRGNIVFSENNTSSHCALSRLNLICLNSSFTHGTTHCQRTDGNKGIIYLSSKII